MVSKKDICAIIVTYNSAAIIGHCLNALSRIGVKSIVVDNASIDETVEISQRQFAEVIINKDNLGFGRANNIGAAATNAKYLLFINPDCLVSPDFLKEVLKAVENYPNAKIFGPQIIEEDGRVFIQARSLLSPATLNNGKRFIPVGDCCIPFVSGACILVEREKFFEVGGFDENIFLFYEDDDLCRKFCDIGLMPIYLHSAKAWHGRGKSSSESKEKTYKVRYHMAWSKIYVSKKYGIPINIDWDIKKLKLKYFLALLSFNRKRKMHYSGSLDGYRDALRAFKSQQL